jgi:hypothetical protein
LTHSSKVRSRSQSSRKVTDEKDRSNLIDTLTICTDEDQKGSSQFKLYGYTIITSPSLLLNSLFNKSKACGKSVVLHNIKPHTLGCYIHWLHTRRLFPCKGDNFKSYTELIDLFLLGEVVKDPIFCQKVVDAMLYVRYAVRQWPGYSVVNDVWERTPPESALRKVVKELWMSTNVHKATGYLKKAPEPGYPKDLILSLLEAVVGRRGDGKEETFLGKSRKEVDDACRGFVKHMSSSESQ